MVLIYSLIFVTILSLVFTSSIKKKYWLYYSLSALIATSTTIYEILRITSNMKLYGFISNLEKASIKGIISIAFFILVMFAGALKPKWLVAKKLLSIRAELAIIASILMLPHGVIYIARFIIYSIPKLINHKLSMMNLGFTIVGFIGFIIMLPLFVTSLKKVRLKMKWSRWKRLQRWAYLFYFLAYLHVLIILLSKQNIDWLKLSTYTIIFGGYTILRLMKLKK